ncbi:MAG: TVP38/TMEM64 family protein [Myxococcota bacterium]
MERPDPTPGPAPAEARRGWPASRWLALVVLAVGVGVAVGLRIRHGVDLDPAALRTWIESQGWRAPLVFVLAASLRIFLVLPSWVVMSAGGLLFGVIGGTVFGTVGFALGSVLVFGLARSLGRDAVEGRLSGGLARMDRYLKRRGARWLGFYTALPVSPLTPAHAAAGLSGMSIRSFSLGVVVGLVPRTGLFSYFGDTLASGDAGRITVALVVVAVAAVVGIRLSRRAGAQASEE